MHTLKNTFYILLLAAVSIFSFTQCTKKETTEPTQSKQDKAATQNALGEALYTDLNGTLASALNAAGLGKTNDLTDNCAIVTVTPNNTFSYPKQIVIDFGSSNCTGSDGKSRRGKLNATLSTFYLLPNAQLIINPSNYYLNDHKIEGTLTTTNTSANNAVSFSQNVQNGKVTLPNNTDGFTWSGSRDFYYDNNGTATITGSASGVTSGNDSFSYNITKPLILKQGCRYITEGTGSLTLNQTPDLLVLDYGTGTCDNQATLTYFNQTRNITLPY